MQMPATINETTLRQEIRSAIEDAKRLPADGVVYQIGASRMVHRPATRMKVEHVIVERYGELWRSLRSGDKWSTIDQCGGSI